MTIQLYYIHSQMAAQLIINSQMTIQLMTIQLTVCIVKGLCS